MKTYGSFTAAEPGSPPPGMYVPIEFPSLALLGTRTRDGRLIDAATFEPFDLPRSIKLKTIDAAGHDGAEVAGRLDEVTIHDDGNASGRGWMLNDAAGRRGAFLVKTQALRGNSVDLSVAEKDVDIRVEEDDQGNWTLEIDFRNARLAATTLLTEPAFENAGAVIPADWDVEGFDATDSLVASVTAAGTSPADVAFAFNVLSEKPKAKAVNFTDPGLTGPTPLYIDEGERVIGHLAAWGVEHISHPGVYAPRSHSDYAYFATRPLRTDDGRISVGCLSIEGNHASETLGWRDTLDHYANTCLAWADVAIGEDDHGIWFSGQVRPGLSAKVLHAGEASGTSGDWRRIGAHLELLAVLSVNTPGFPIPRARTYGHEQDFPLTLIGAGALAPRQGRIDLGKIPTTFSKDIGFLARRFATEDARQIAAELDSLGDF